MMGRLFLLQRLGYFVLVIPDESTLRKLNYSSHICKMTFEYFNYLRTNLIHPRK